MSYCLNPACTSPQNSRDSLSCQSCGAKLLLKERYRAIKPIGQGGFGKTFLAVDQDKPSKPPCVIKLFYPSSQGTDSIKKATQLFTQEAQRLQSLGKHPQIPELIDYLEQDEKLYLVQEYIEGQDLAEILSEEGVFSEKQVRALLARLLPVLQFVHENNVIHRDIKPENIIRRNDGQYVLVDFGAARYVTGTALLRTSTMIGDVRYMSDEQLQGKATFASDIYTLGLTCLHLLTQVEPLSLYDTSEGEWVWRDYLTTPVSRELGQVIDKMVQKPTKRRFGSVGEVLEALTPVGDSFKKSSVVTPTPRDNQPVYKDRKVIVPPLFNVVWDKAKELAKVGSNHRYSQAEKIGNQSHSQELVKRKSDKWSYWVLIVAGTLACVYFVPHVKEVFTNVPSPDLSLSDQTLKPFQAGSQWGYKDKMGQVVISPQFDEVGDFSEGLARVKNKNKWGYIDKTGKIIIVSNFDWVGDFSKGLAIVQLNNKYDFIDKTGQITSKYSQDGLFFSEGLAAVGLNGKYGYIDKTGKIVIPLKFDLVKGFSEGLAVVASENKYGFIDFSDKYGFVDKTGKIVIPLKFDLVKGFSEGLAQVNLNDNWGYIDKTGKLVTEWFDRVEDFSEGLAGVNLNGNWGYIDKTGKVVIPLQFDEVKDFSEGLAQVNLNDNWGYIDKTGKIVIQPQFVEAESFENGRAKVTIELQEEWGTNRKEGYIDKTGKWIEDIN